MKYKSSVQLLALNDDCFLELFKYLSVEDLCTMKQTNLRLWNLVEYYFQSIYTNKAYEVRLRNFDSKKLNEILQQCGKFIRQLVIESPRNYSDLKDFRENFDDIDDNRDDLLDSSNDDNNDNGTHYIGDLIGKYCSNKLQRLHLHDVYISGFATTISLAHVLNNLDTIVLEKCIGAADQFMRHCPNVRTIVQRNCAFFLALDQQNYLLQNEYAQLERLIIYNENQIDLMVPEVLHAFFELPRNLTCLHYINRDAPTPTEMLPQIVRSTARNLTELCIELETFSTSFTTDLRCLLELSQLKRLEFNTDEIPVTVFINELAASQSPQHHHRHHHQLECIGISDVCLDESLCQAFMKFTELNVLKLIAPLLEFEDFFLVLSQRLHRLEQLYLVQCSDIRFAHLMAFVENCPQLNTIYLYESPPIDWSILDSFEQFSIDFVHLYKLRSNMVAGAASSIDIYFDSNMVRLIEEHVWPHEYEWFTKNDILRLKIADDNVINELPGYCPKIDNRY